MSGPVIALAAGGTGGHVFPAQALAGVLARRGYSPFLITDKRGAAFAAKAPELDFTVLPAATLRGGILQKIGQAATISTATARAAWLLQSRKARAVVGFGGYPSFAPAMAAKLVGIALVLHEQGTRFSLANRKLLPYANRIALSFPVDDPAAKEARTHLTGPAIRAAIAAVAGSPYPAMDGPIELLVVGGSQGASVFSEAVPDSLARLPAVLRKRLRLALQYPGDDERPILAKLRDAGIRAEVAPFFHDMAERLVDAHLVISRAGASTAADLTAVGRPAIFVPIPAGGSVGEQRNNAMAFEKAGAGWCLLQDEMEKGALTAMLMDLLSGDALPRAAAASAALGKADGAEALADVIAELVPKK